MSETLALAPEQETAESRARDIGERVLWKAGVFKHELGVNDPLTHLEQYLRQGEAAMASIDEEFITDCAERMEKPVFEHAVAFRRAGNDFISRENKISMRKITKTTEYKFAGNVADMKLYRRAKIESAEVDKLHQWFDAARIDDGFVVESVGLSDTETYNILRIYQKASDDELIQHIIPLHNSTVGTFNKIHKKIGAAVPDSKDQLALLGNMYAIRPAGDKTFNGFIKSYVAAHDEVLAEQNPGREFSYGLPKETVEREDDMAAIRRQLPLRQLYHRGIRALGQSGGYVTPELMALNRDQKLGLGLSEGRVITAAAARQILDASLQSVVATLNRASKTELDILAAGDSSGAARSAGGYGSAARSEGVRYEGACPSGSAGAAAAEAAALALGYKFNKDPSQCGTCPKCQKEYYVPDVFYKAKILHCDNCKASIHFNGEAVDQELIDKYYGRTRGERLNPFTLWWRKEGRLEKIKNLAAKREQAESEYEFRRIGKLIAKEETALLELIEAA